MKIRAGDSKRLKEKGEKPIVNSSLDIQKTVIKKDIITKSKQELIKKILKRF